MVNPKRCRRFALPPQSKMKSHAVTSFQRIGVWDWCFSGAWLLVIEYFISFLATEELGQECFQAGEDEGGDGDGQPEFEAGAVLLDVAFQVPVRRPLDN